MGVAAPNGMLQLNSSMSGVGGMFLGFFDAAVYSVRIVAAQIV